MGNCYQAGQRALTAKQERFAELVAQGKKASEAYREAYNARGMKAEAVHVAASRVRNNAKVAAKIDALLVPARAQTLVEVAETTHIDLARTLFENVRIAFSDVGQLYDAEGNLIPVHKLPEDVRRAIASIEVVALYGEGKDAKGEIGYTKKIKFWNKGEALDRLMKHLGGYEKDNAQKRDPVDDIPREVRKQMAAYISALARRSEVEEAPEGNLLPLRPAPKKLKVAAVDSLKTRRPRSRPAGADRIAGER